MTFWNWCVVRSSLFQQLERKWLRLCLEKLHASEKTQRPTRPRQVGGKTGRCPNVRCAVRKYGRVTAHLIMHCDQNRPASLSIALSSVRSTWARPTFPLTSTPNSDHNCVRIWLYQSAMMLERLTVFLSIYRKKCDAGSGWWPFVGGPHIFN